MQSTDGPILEFAQDRLGYTSFAHTLASGILGRRDVADGYIIGVEARWGMGKTSAINLTLAAIEEAQKNTNLDERIVAVRISIWPTSGSEVLAKSYLQQLEAALKANFEFRSASQYKRQIGKFVKKATNAIEAGSSGVAILSGAGAPAAGIVGKLSGAFTSIFGSFLDPESIEKVTSDLRGDLLKIKGQLLVIIDDLDRLHPDEVRQLLTLVKTFGDLPRVTHLLLYDRQIVDDALASAMRTQSQGPTYLEKIVQLSVALPVVPHWRLLDLLRARLSVISESFDQSGLNDIWRKELRDFLVTPRDIIRLVNALAVGWPSIADHANLLDFLCLESVRLTEQGAWRAIRDMRFELVGRSDRIRPSNNLNIGGIVLLADESRRTSLQAMIERLFPQSGPRGGLYVNLGDLRLRRSVGCPEYVDVYFQLQPGSALGASEINEFLAHIDDDSEIRRMILGLYFDRNKLRAILNGLNDAVKVIAGARTEKLFSVLLDIGDELLARSFNDPPISYDQDVLTDLDSLLWSLLSNIPPDHRERTVISAINNSKSMTIPAVIWQRLALKAGILPESSQARSLETLLPDQESINRVGAVLTQHLRAAHQNGDARIFEAPLLGWVLKIWAQAGDGSGASAAAKSFIDVDHSLVSIVDSEMGLSFSGKGAERKLRSEPEVPGVAGRVLAERVKARLADPNFLSRVFPLEQQVNFRAIAETFEKLASEQMSGWTEAPWEIRVPS